MHHIEEISSESSSYDEDVLPEGIHLLATTRERLERLRQVEAELDGLACDKAKIMLQVGHPAHDLAGFLVSNLSQRRGGRTTTTPVLSDLDLLLRDVLCMAKHGKGAAATWLGARADAEVLTLVKREQRLEQEHAQCLRDLVGLVTAMLGPSPPDQLMEEILLKHPDIGGPLGYFPELGAHAIGQEMPPVVAATVYDEDGASFSSSSVHLLEEWDASPPSSAWSTPPGFGGDDSMLM